MGQYYIIVNVDTKAFFTPWSCPLPENERFCPGAKLTAHSYRGSNVVKCLESLLVEGGPWYKASVVWAGDYADNEAGHILQEEDGTRSEANLYRLCSESTLGTMEEDLNLPKKHFRYIVNHDTDQFVDTVKMMGDYHPLPLLTVEGNGRGGGDFYCDGCFPEELVGEWARAKLSVRDAKPLGAFHELRVYVDYSWNTVGHFILIRELCQQGRATEAAATRDSKRVETVTSVLPEVMLNLEEDIFRTVLSFLF